MDSPQRTSPDSPAQKRTALQLILLLGLVSALGDITYESARSISGPYLAFLGAGAGIVGLVSGFGEFIGYGLRLVSGYVADRTRSYWLATFIGYGLLLCIPLLAFAGRWEMAALLLILERAGKAIRSPSRDTILSHATQQTGRGWGFAIHEALDQVGAVIGPLVFTAAFLVRNSYRDGFAVLWIPALLTIAALALARVLVPSPEKLETSSETTAPKAQASGRLPRVFWLYALFTFLSVAGFANFQVISYHLTVRAAIPTSQIPILYALAMGVDALAALFIGKAYDRIGLRSLGIIPLLSIPIPLLGFSSGGTLAVASVILWGVVMAFHETTMRAAIADIAPVGRRASAYGIFNTVYGAAWFVGGAAMGWLYDFSIAYLALFVAAVEVVSLPVFWAVTRSSAIRRPE